MKLTLGPRAPTVMGGREAEKGGVQPLESPSI